MERRRHLQLPGQQYAVSALHPLGERNCSSFVGATASDAADSRRLRGVPRRSDDALRFVRIVCNLGIGETLEKNDPSSDLMIAQCNFFDGVNLPTARVADFPELSNPRSAGDVWFGDDNS